MIKRRTLLLTGLIGVLGASTAPTLSVAGAISEIRIDYATYNPVSLVLKQQGLLEKAFAKDGIAKVDEEPRLIKRFRE